MAEIYTAEEQSDIINEVLGGYNSKFYWIGLTDSAVEGQFIWQHSSKPLGWSNWNGGEPNNNFGNEDCVLLLKSLYNRKWNDADCGSENGMVSGDYIYALCEYRF